MINSEWLESEFVKMELDPDSNCDNNFMLGARWLLEQYEAAQQSVQRIGGRLCENCGEPLENHVGGVGRGLCKNPANR